MKNPNPKYQEEVKIPDNMSEEQVFEIVMKVSQRHAMKYVFGSYEYEDIVQEAFLIGCEGLKDYDGIRPLETFLYVHINNRLKNFKRKNFCRQEVGESAKIQNVKKNLISPISIDLYPEVDLSSVDFLLDLEQEEILKKIDSNLSYDLRRDYLRMLSGDKVPAKRRNVIIQEIRSILGIPKYEER